MSESGGPSESVAGELQYGDPSGAIFKMYLEKAQKYDDAKAEIWKRSAESILIFTGLFSGTVGGFILSSYPLLQPDPDDVTHLLLAQISQQLSGASNNLTIPSVSTIIDQNSFRPSTSAVALNCIWFLSLTLSLTAALGATLLHQWTARYIHVTQLSHAPHTRAAIRGYLARGVDKFRLSILVDGLPALLLLSMFLFFIGLIIFIFDINHTVAYFTISVVALCFLAYIALTLMPVISHDSPYLTPLSPFLWALFFYRLAKDTNFDSIWHGLWKIVVGFARFPARLLSGKVSEEMVNMLEESAGKDSLAVYREALEWTVDHLDEDYELEAFAKGIPGLYRSTALKSYLSTSQLLKVLPGPKNFNKHLSWSIIHLAKRTNTLEFRDEANRGKRREVCIRALYHIPGAIHEALSLFAAKRSYCLEILPLINSIISMRISVHMQEAADQDSISLSARCLTAVITAFALTPPSDIVLWSFPPGTPYIGNDDARLPLLSTRLNLGAEKLPAYLTAEDGSDCARLENLTLFLTDIMQFLANLHHMDAEEVIMEDCLQYQEIRKERDSIHKARHSPEYVTGEYGRVLGNHASPAYIPAVQYDLVKLTLEILTRDSVDNAGEKERDAFRNVVMKLQRLRDGVPQGMLPMAHTYRMVFDSLHPIFCRFWFSPRGDVAPVSPAVRQRAQEKPPPRHPQGSLSGTSWISKAGSSVSNAPDPNVIADPGSFPLPALSYDRASSPLEEIV